VIVVRIDLIGPYGFPGFRTPANLVQAHLRQ
jgi:hypothetical protein